MYEHFKNEFIVDLENNFTTEQLQMISKTLDKIIINYEIRTKSTEIILLEDAIPSLLKTYLVCKKLQGLSENTLYNYNMYLRNFFLKVNKEVEDITGNDIRVYLYLYQSERNNSNRSLEKIRQTICGFFNWAYEEEYLQKNPTKSVQKIKYEEKPRQSLTQIELEYVRKACDNIRDSAIVEVLYSTGCRVSELTDLKISDIDFQTKRVHLFGKGKKHRLSYINAKAEVVLKEYLKTRSGDSEYLFVSQRKPYEKLSKAAVEKIVRNVSLKIENNNKNITPHIFRHTTATTAINNGMPVQSIQLMLGHSNIGTTMIYAHTNVEHLKEEHRKSVI